MPPLFLNTRGAVAVEFAIVSPVFLLILLGIMSYGTLFGIGHSVQQLAAEAARAAVSGLSDAERTEIAGRFVQASAGSYSLLDPTRLTLSSRTTDVDTRTFEVALTYDASSSYVYGFAGLLPLPDPTVRRAAVIRHGGF